jgi:methylated-DNA-[protein]-cysteine S-methyltransferase
VSERALRGAYGVFAGPWGPVHVAVRGGAVVAIGLLTTSGPFVASVERRLRCQVVPASAAESAEGSALGGPAGGPDRRLLALAARQIDDYWAGSRRELQLPFELVGLSDWDRLVLAGVRTIPYGCVTSYGRLARLVGRPGAARAVGGAVGRNPIGLIVPCHRVIAGDGSLGGYGGEWYGGREESLALKRRLLEREGTQMPARRFVG